MSQKIIAAPSIVWRDVAGDLVLFDQLDGQYHALNQVGSAIWRELARGRSVSELIEELAKHYEAAPDDIAADVAAFLATARDKGLVIDIGAAA